MEKENDSIGTIIINIPDKYIRSFKFLADMSEPPYEKDYFFRQIFYQGAVEYLLVTQKQFLSRAEIDEGNKPDTEERRKLVTSARILGNMAESMLNEMGNLEQIQKERV